MGDLIKLFVKSLSIPEQGQVYTACGITVIDNKILYPLSGTNHHTSAINHDDII